MYSLNSRLVVFDENSKLAEIEHTMLKDYLEPFIVNAIHDDRGKILHFSSEDCHCSQYSNKHIADIDRLAQKNSFEVLNIQLKEHEVIPATPSVAILNNIGDVIYFGPYGEGLACTKTEGYAQTVVHNYLKGFSSNLIIKEAKGCYCAV